MGRNNAYDSRAVSDKDALAVGRHIAGVLELGDDFRAFQDLVRLERTVEDRDGDRGLAAAQDPVAELAHCRDHADLPQRWSYWMKFGSALSSFSRPMRLFMMPPRYRYPLCSRIDVIMGWLTPAMSQ